MTNGVYTAITNFSAFPIKYNASNCTCSNHIQEVYYTVTFNNESDNFLYPESVTVQFVLSDTSTSTCSSSTFTPVTQLWNVEFVMVNVNTSIDFSGNPGYLMNEPLILGKSQSDNTVLRPYNGV